MLNTNDFKKAFFKMDVYIKKKQQLILKGIIRKCTMVPEGAALDRLTHQYFSILILILYNNFHIYNKIK